MWRVRQKELDLENRRKGRSTEESSSSSGRSHLDLPRHSSKTYAISDENKTGSCSSTRTERCNSTEEGLRDEEIEKFLCSRVKRGRGSIGSRMDETGPYLPPSPDSPSTIPNYREHRVILGPVKPPSRKSSELSSSDEEFDGRRRKKAKKDRESSDKKHCRKHKSKHKSKDKKDKRDKKKERKRSRRHS